jgi:sarcosine oxidase, subunit gamma
MAEEATAEALATLLGDHAGKLQGGIALAAATPFARFVLRGDEDARLAIGDAFKLALPEAINRAASQGGRAALKLGPDEWLLLAPQREGEALAAALGHALAPQAASLVDVSHRQIGLALSGPLVETVLNGAVPLDLAHQAFPVGMATRTLLDKAEIVLWRTGPQAFHLEVWRSFAPYVAALLQEIAAEGA